MIKICHLTSVHTRYDTRIFVKECCSLAANGYDVTLLVADGLGDEEKNKVKIIDLGKPKSRINRILFWRKKNFDSALSINAEIYHFHDPELLPIGRKLISKGKKVIYDSHEDVPRQILDKAYIPAFFRKPLSNIIERYENKIISKLSGVVTVTPNLERRFLNNNKNVVQVCNFPKIQEFEIEDSLNLVKENVVCYIGAISKVRGVLGMVEAMQFHNETKLLLGGKFENEDLRKQAVASKGWKNIYELGFLTREKVKSILQKSIAGLVVLEPTPSYLESIPVKMFEYMIAGIPVIASDFPYWRELIEAENCALFVDPQNPEEISKAIKSLVENKKMAAEMGSRGQEAVYKKFNWSKEEEKLLRFYKSLVNMNNKHKK